MTRSLPPDWDDDRRPDGGDDPHGNLAPTDWKVVIVAALCGAALGWFTLSIYKVSDNTVPILPWSLPVVILVVAVATWGYARAFRAKVVDPKREVEANQGLVSLCCSRRGVHRVRPHLRLAPQHPLPPGADHRRGGDSHHLRGHGMGRVVPRERLQGAEGPGGSGRALQEVTATTRSRLASVQCLTRGPTDCT